MMNKKDLKRYQSSAPISELALLNLLKEFKTKKIAVLGDIGIDRYTVGAVERISPEAPVPIVLVQDEYLKLGLAANVADNLIALGSKPVLTGMVGKDEDAKILKDLLQKKKISTSHIVTDSERRTILKERIVAETQQMLRVDYESMHSVSSGVEKKVLKSILEAIRDCDALIIEDYAKGLLSEELCQSAIKVAKKMKIPVLIDPHLKTPATWYRGCTLLTPNRREAEGLTGMRMLTQDSVKTVGHSLMKMTQAESLVITLGRDGMAVFSSPGANPLFIPTFAQEVYDVSGAGDTVISVLALALSCESKLDEAAYISNLAAGVEVSKRGTATVTTDEIVNAFLLQQKN